VNAALVMIIFALTGKPSLGEAKDTGQVLAFGVELGVARVMKHETPPIFEQAELFSG
jgi:hypothetical protein